MSKEDKLQKSLRSVYKKDTSGLFEGGYRSEVFSTKEEKQDRQRKSTKQYLDEAEENENNG